MSNHHAALWSACSPPIDEHRYNINILAISETHLDNSFDDTAVAIQGYNIYRRDINAYGGGVAVYIQSHIPVLL